MYGNLCTASRGGISRAWCNSASEKYAVTDAVTARQYLLSFLQKRT